MWHTILCGSQYGRFGKLPRLENWICKPVSALDNIIGLPGLLSSMRTRVKALGDRYLASVVWPFRGKRNYSNPCWPSFHQFKSYEIYSDFNYHCYVTINGNFIWRHTQNSQRWNNILDKIGHSTVYMVKGQQNLWL